jgi:hypothetical protein
VRNFSCLVFSLISLSLPASKHAVFPKCWEEPVLYCQKHLGYKLRAISVSEHFLLILPFFLEGGVALHERLVGSRAGGTDEQTVFLRVTGVLQLRLARCP